MSDIAKLIDKLRDSVSIVVYFPLISGEYQKQNAIFKKAKAPAFDLIFPPNTLPIAKLDKREECRLLVPKQENSVAFLASLNSLDEKNRSGSFTGKERINPEMLREYFRVPLRVPIKACFEPGPGNLNNSPWEIEGETVDLSGSGLLADFPSSPPSNYNIRLEIDLSECNQESFVMQASVVRINQLRKKRYQVAFHFETLEQRIRDTIISCCLQEQRKQLREKVRTE